MDNSNIQFDFKSIREKDIDLLLIEEICYNDVIRNAFLSQISDKALSEIRVTEAIHSRTDAEFGESDITIILDTNCGKHALLIEDKIDAVAMPDQAKRYILRGEKGIKAGLYHRYSVFIVAPKKYLESNEEAKKYEHRISYEQILDLLIAQNDASKGFKIAQIRFAIEEHKNGYQAIENKAVTEFWKNYYEYQANNYPLLELTGSPAKKATNALWPRFRTDRKDLYILHKSDSGFVDLTFRGMASKSELFRKLLTPYLEKDMKIVVTSSSMAVRIIVPVILFKNPFSYYEGEIKDVFETVSRLTGFANNLDCDIINKLYAK